MFPGSSPPCLLDTVLSQFESLSHPENLEVHLPPCAHQSPKGNSQPVHHHTAMPLGKMQSAPRHAPHSNQFRDRLPPSPNAYSQWLVQIGLDETQPDTDVRCHTTFPLPHSSFANEKTFVLHRPEKIRGLRNAAKQSFPSSRPISQVRNPPKATGFQRPLAFQTGLLPVIVEILW